MCPDPLNFSELLGPLNVEDEPERYRDGKLLCNSHSVRTGKRCKAFVLRGHKKCQDHIDKPLLSLPSSRLNRHIKALLRPNRPKREEAGDIHFWRYPKSQGPGKGAKFPDRYRDGKLLCDGWSRQQGAPCRAFAMRGRKQCKNHGGKALRGLQSPRLKHGRKSKSEDVKRRWKAIEDRLVYLIAKDLLHQESGKLGRPLSPKEMVEVWDAVPKSLTQLLSAFGVDAETMWAIEEERDRAKAGELLGRVLVRMGIEAPEIDDTIDKDM